LRHAGAACRASVADKRGLPANQAAASLVSTLVAHQAVSFASRDDDEQCPQAISIGQVRESVAVRSSTKARQGAECDVLFVRHSAGRASQLPPGHSDKSLEVIFPKLLGRRWISRFEAGDPGMHGFGRRHGQFPSMKGNRGIWPSY
jgi:hypothetical protein